MSTTDLSVSPERWLPVPDFEGLYDVSDRGRVRSARSGRIRRTHFSRKGREHLDLHRAGQRHDVQVHSLVLLAFVGPRPDGMEGCHNDGDPTHNALENLRWDTRRENNIDSIRHGTHPWASRTHCSHGHEYTPENTYLSPQGWRRCRMCMARRLQKYRASNRAVSTEAVTA